MSLIFVTLSLTAHRSFGCQLYLILILCCHHIPPFSLFLFRWQPGDSDADSDESDDDAQTGAIASSNCQLVWAGTVSASARMHVCPGPTMCCCANSVVLDQSNFHTFFCSGFLFCHCKNVAFFQTTFFRLSFFCVFFTFSSLLNFSPCFPLFHRHPFQRTQARCRRRPSPSSGSSGAAPRRSRASTSPTAAYRR